MTKVTNCSFTRSPGFSGRLDRRLTSVPVDAPRVWPVFAEHLALLYAGARNLTAGHGAGWFAVLSREQHTDVNICVLLPDATTRSSEAVVRLIEEAGVPAIVSVSSRLDERTIAPLPAAGFVVAPVTEPLMWLQSRPQPSANDFEVRRITTSGELRRAIEVAAEVHEIERDVLTGLLTRVVRDDERVTTWIAWDAGEPISVAWLTLGAQIGVWQMMTPARHRRCGAARATLTTALHELWDDRVRGAFLWATPAGRPLYKRVGFAALDESRTWVLGGSEAANLVLGHPGRAVSSHPCRASHRRTAAR